MGKFFDDHQMNAYAPAQPKRNIICLCGSTKFKQEYERENKRLSLEGNVVLSVSGFHHADDYPLTDDQKTLLDLVHKSKIDLADEIFVLNVGGYVGQSTMSEITYAMSHGKIVRYLEPADTTLTLYYEPIIQEQQ
jgi:hypothetical protein